MRPPPGRARVAFDNFEVNTRSGELRKNGSRIRLQAQPFQLLLQLLRDAGEVVTRDEISRELWPADTFVDFEHSLAAAVNKLREALGDSAENPKYIETLPKRGYRFIGKIEPDAPVALPALESKETAALATVPVPTVKAHGGRWLAAIALAAIIVATFFVATLSRNSEAHNGPAFYFLSRPGDSTIRIARRLPHRVFLGQCGDEKLPYASI